MTKSTAVPAPLVAGPYLIREALAAGSFGAVCRAVHRRTGAELAVKILHRELLQNTSAVRRFELEIEVLRRLRHPHLVEILDAGRLPDGRPYFVMEMLRGTVLKARLDAIGRLTIPDSLAILDPIAEALGAAHAMGVIHRDIKPSNVFLAEEEGRQRVVLLDFGIAKLLDTAEPRITNSRHSVGTYSCMAPEQILCGCVDVWTDVYGLGALAYRMLTGRPPFEGDASVLRRLHLEGRPRPPSAHAPLSAAIDAVILKALSRSAAARHPTPADFVAELRAAAITRPAAAPAPRPVFVVRFEAQFEGDPEAAPPALLDEADALVTRVREQLCGAGFDVLLEASTQLAFARPLPAFEDPDNVGERRRGLSAVAALALEARERTPRVRACFAVHAGEGLANDVLDQAPEVDGSGGVIASSTAIRGIEPRAAAAPG